MPPRSTSSAPPPSHTYIPRFPCSPSTIHLATGATRLLNALHPSSPLTQQTYGPNPTPSHLLQIVLHRPFSHPKGPGAERRHAPQT